MHTIGKIALLAIAGGFTATAQTFGYTGAIVQYTIPVTGLYQITAAGAQGGAGSGTTGGLGAALSGQVFLTAGTVLNVAVGQQGTSGGGVGGGGGGSFVVGPGGAPLVVAGGGGGGGFQGSNGLGGVTSSSGTNANGAGGMGGSGGFGGGDGGGALGDGGGGGAGFYGNGAGGTTGGQGVGGKDYANSLSGGMGFGGGVGGNGGFGGGGGGGAIGGGGGGGGYSGGGGASYDPGTGNGNGGGGGGSYFDASVTNTSAVGGAQMGNGSVIVALIAPVILNYSGSGVEDAFQVNYASQLNQADSVLNITNSGSAATTTGSIASPANTPGLGNICVNIYVFNPDEELEACCSCVLTPNELLSIAYIDTINGAPGLLSNTANPSKTDMTSAVTKLVATTGTPCNNVRPVFGTPGNVTAALPITPGTLAPGLTAWTTHAHLTNAPLNPNGTFPVHITETQFSQESLGQGEANFLANTCASFVHNSSGAGICSCPTSVGGFTR